MCIFLAPKPMNENVRKIKNTYNIYIYFIYSRIATLLILLPVSIKDSVLELCSMILVVKQTHLQESPDL
jgi:hypothetical protein